MHKKSCKPNQRFSNRSKSVKMISKVSNIFGQKEVVRVNKVHVIKSVNHNFTCKNSAYKMWKFGSTQTRLKTRYSASQRLNTIISISEFNAFSRSADFCIKFFEQRLLKMNDTLHWTYYRKTVSEVSYSGNSTIGLRCCKIAKTCPFVSIKFWKTCSYWVL